MARDSARQAWDQTLLGTISPTASDELFNASRLDTAQPGEILSHGSSASCFVVVEGVSRVYITTPTGRQKTMRYIQEAEVVGLQPLVAGSMPNWWVEAVTDVSIIRVPSDRLKPMLKQEITLSNAVMEHLAKVSAGVFDMLSTDLFVPVRARVARHLLDLAQRETEGLVVTANHQDIANATGSVREVVSREMKRFADRGLVTQIPSGTLLVDTAELHRTSLSRTG